MKRYMESALCHKMITWSSKCLGGVIFLSISGILGVYAILATFCSLFGSVSKQGAQRTASVCEP